MAICHSAQGGWSKVEDLDELSELRAGSGNVLWAEADVSNLTADDVAVISEEFALHPLAVEDAMNTRQRPKIEAYHGHQFIVFHQLDEVADQLEAVQIACFVGDGYVLTIHAGAKRVIEAAKARWSESDTTAETPESLLHTLFDVVVDEYQEIADRLEQEMEDLEEIALESPGAPLQRQLYSVKQSLARMRRYVLPAARVVEWALGPSSTRDLSDEMRPLFRDVHDHLLRIADEIRNIDDLSQAVLDLTRSEQTTALGEVSKRLTAWAAIFAVLTLIAGIYGMNFELVPEDQTLFGFWFAIGIMVVCGGGLFTYFKRRGWL